MSTTSITPSDLPVANSPMLGSAATTPRPLLLDVNACAALLAISARSWLRLVERGEAPRPVKLGRLTRWRATDVDAFVAALGTDRRAA